MFTQRQICVHRDKSVYTEANMCTQRQICLHRDKSVYTEANMCTQRQISVSKTEQNCIVINRKSVITIKFGLIWLDSEKISPCVCSFYRMYLWNTSYLWIWFGMISLQLFAIATRLQFPVLLIANYQMECEYKMLHEYIKYMI